MFSLRAERLIFLVVNISHIVGHLSNTELIG